MIYNQGFGGGMKPKIIVTAPTGTVVTATKGTTVITAGESGGKYVILADDYGTWTITGTKGSHISQESSYDATEGSFEWTPPSVIHDDGMGTDRSISTAAYIRLNMLNTTMPVSDAIVTINEEII